MGADYQPSPALSDALSQLVAALDGDDEVGGFATGLRDDQDLIKRSSFTFDSRDPNTTINAGFIKKGM